jgi:hypothetical protein
LEDADLAGWVVEVLAHMQAVAFATCLKEEEEVEEANGVSLVQSVHDH